jgi:hypothetical protein
MMMWADECFAWYNIRLMTERENPTSNEEKKSRHYYREVYFVWLLVLLETALLGDLPTGVLFHVGSPAVLGASYLVDRATTRMNFRLKNRLEQKISRCLFTNQTLTSPKWMAN